jgi:mannose-6-phosphate isomerase-like protein (cupin superfamily)
MPLKDYVIFTKPNRWTEPKYSRPYYDIMDKRTGKKYRISNSEVWNNPERLSEYFGNDAQLLSAEIQRREKDIEQIKEKYLEMYEAVKSRYDAGLKIPKSWMAELEDMFDQMHQKDASFGEMTPGADTLKEMQRTQNLKHIPVTTSAKPTAGVYMANDPSQVKTVPRIPEQEAPHIINMPNAKRFTVNDDEFYQGMNLQRAMSKLSNKCKAIEELSKDDVSGTGTTGATPIRAIGYVGESANTQTPEYRNPMYDKKKKKKEKVFMKAHGFVGDIEELTNRNKAFRHVLYTGSNSQLVVMSLKPGEEIGMEVHEDVDQFFRVDSGVGMVIIDGHKYKIQDGTGIVVPAGAKHNVVNISKEQDLKLYTIYSPPEHKDQVVRETKQEAEQKKEEFDGKTTE